MNAGSTPERVGYTHLADQPTNLDGQLRPAGCSRSRFPTPEGAKAGAMPADNRLGSHNGNRLENARCKSVKQYENEAIEPAEGRALGCAPTEYIQLLAPLFLCKTGTDCIGNCIHKKRPGKASGRHAASRAT